MKKTKLLMPIAGASALAATIVTITTITSCNKNDAVTAGEIEWIKELNTVLGKTQTIKTCHQALTIAKEAGYDLANVKLSNAKSNFAFDLKAKQFIIMNNNNVVACSDGYTMSSNTYDVFQFVDKYDKTLKYSQYLKDGFDLDTLNGNTLEITTGLDVGTNKNIERIKYVGDSSAKEITIRTYCDVFEVESTKDTIYHYDVANNIYVNAKSAAVTECKYTEVGKAAYLKIANTEFSTKYINESTSCAVDTVEVVGNNVTVGEFATATVTISITDGGTIPAALKAIFPDVEITKVSKESELLPITNKSAFIRLTDNITFTETNAWVISKAVDTSTYIVLDLDGKTISDQGASQVSGSGRIKVTGGATLTVMDSEKENTAGSIELYEHSIIIDGDNTSTATIILNGANFHYHTNGANQRGAIYVGHTGEQTAENKSELFMYGGKITATVDDATKKGSTNAIGISPRGKGSYVQILYGSLDCYTSCIAGNGSYDGSYVDIVGGNFVTESEIEPCVFQPQGGTLHIVGGYFEGGSCIGLKDGDVTIANATMVATGDYKEDIETKGSGIDCDGSCILIDANGVNEQGAGYGLNPVITVTNCTMWSHHGYVMRCFGDKTRFVDKGGLVEADFFGGTYVYKQATPVSEEEKQDMGYRVETNMYWNTEVHVQNGTWVRA